MLEFIKQEIQKTRAVISQIEQDSVLLDRTIAIAKVCIAALRNKHKILFVGNGGSAADSQHLAAELVSRLRYDRPGLAAIALTTDTSALTAIGNDYSYEALFSRQIEAIAQSGDVLIAISTSGKSPNILHALATARKQGLTTIGFTGQTTIKMAEYCDFLLNIPSSETPKIQECHIVLGHIICALIEEDMFGAEYNPARKAAVTA